MECLQCKHDLSQFATWDFLDQDFIECPACGNKMVVEYDYWQSDDDEDLDWWYLLQFQENGL